MPSQPPTQGASIWAGGGRPGPSRPWVGYGPFWGFAAAARWHPRGRPRRAWGDRRAGYSSDAQHPQPRGCEEATEQRSPAVHARTPRGGPREPLAPAPVHPSRPPTSTGRAAGSGRGASPPAGPAPSRVRAPPPRGGGAAAREGRPAPAEQRGRPKRRVPGGRPRRPERGPERAPAPRPRASCTNFPGGGRGGRRGPAAPALPVLKLSLIFKGTRRM